MPRASLEDLNLHLFAQLERLDDEELEGEQLEKEIARSNAMTQVATKIIDNASLALQAAKLQGEYGRGGFTMPQLLVGNKKDA